MQAVQRMGNHGLVLGIKGGGGFVHQQYWCLPDQRTGNAHTLAFATGKPRPPFAHERIEAPAQPFEGVCQAGHVRRLPYLGVAGIGFADTDVVGDAALEQPGVLQYLADRVGQAGAGHLPHVDTANAHTAFGGIEEPCNQAHQ